MPVHSLQSRRRLAAALMVFGITMRRWASAQETVAADERRTLSQAIALAGPSAQAPAGLRPLLPVAVLLVLRAR